MNDRVQRRGAEKPAVGRLIGNLGRAGVALAQAEVRGMRSELAETGRLAARTGAWGALAGALAFWGGAVLTAAAVVALQAWVSLLVALLIVGGSFLVLALIAGLVARARAQRLESPALALRRRAEDHVRWWREELALGAEEPGEGDGA